jgi:ATP-dependent DNA helicase RecG
VIFSHHVSNFSGKINKCVYTFLYVKKSLLLKDEIGAAISAFSNAKGGVILIGVTDTGKISGVDIGANTIENEANYIKRHTDPQIFPSIKFMKSKTRR